MYKITVVPFIKMLNFLQSAYIWHLLGLKIKMIQIFMTFGRSRNYSARGLIVKYV